MCKVWRHAKRDDVVIVTVLYKLLGVVGAVAIHNKEALLSHRALCRPLIEVLKALKTYSIELSMSDRQGRPLTAAGQVSPLQLRLIIRECNWSDPNHGREILFQTASLSIEGCAFLEPLEGLIGSKFSKKSLLLEGVTHGSYLPDTNHRNQGRLEFLGDAILDIIVVTKLASHVPKLPHHVMHMIKTAMVNKDFLAFLSLEEHERPQAEDSKAQNRYPGANHGRLALWQFLRHASSGLISAQSETRQRHQEEREDILRTIHHGAIYPWALLLRLQAKKFFSDLFEFVLGAIWVDSGSLAQCEAFLARMGMMSYLGRILRDSVHIQHPKEELTKLAGAEKVI